MERDNLALWRSVERTDPAFVKEITGKQYRGNSPSPHWIKMRLTETFGPAGIGWGTKVLDERVVQHGDRLMHYLRLQLWFVHDGQRGEIEEFGGTELAGKRKSGDLFADEDAPKKSMTDALVKAASALGFAADIFLGRWDDSKYVEQRKEEVRAEKAASAASARADVLRQVDGLVQQLANCATEGDLTELRATAAAIRPDLKAMDLRDATATLGQAITDAAKRLGVTIARAA